MLAWAGTSDAESGAMTDKIDQDLHLACLPPLRTRGTVGRSATGDPRQLADLHSPAWSAETLTECTPDRILATVAKSLWRLMLSFAILLFATDQTFRPSKDYPVGSGPLATSTVASGGPQPQVRSSDSTSRRADDPAPPPRTVAHHLIVKEDHASHLTRVPCCTR